MSKSRSLPTVATFQPAEVERYVRDQIYFKNKVTWLGWVTGILTAGGGFALVQFVEVWMIAAAAGGFFISGSSLTRDLLRRESIRISYLDMLNKQLEGQAAEMSSWLDEQFQSLGHAEGKRLVERLETHMSTLEEVLEAKFQPGTTTFKHFFGIAETLHIETLNVLKDAVTQLKVINAIDVAHATEMAAAAKTEEEKAPHQRRIDSHAEGKQRLSELLMTAESAIVGLVDLKQEVAEIKGGNAEDFSDFLGKVRGLADRAGLYTDERTITSTD